MLKKPRLKYCYHAEFLAKDKVILKSEKDNTILAGVSYTQVLSKINQKGVYVEDLVKLCEGTLTKMEVYVALEILEKKGYITEEVQIFPPEICAFWNSSGIECNRLYSILKKKGIILEFIGQVKEKIFTDAFTGAGIQVHDKEDTGSLRVIITDDYQNKELQQINRKMFISQKPWMLIKPVGTVVWIGPLFLSGSTGCWECLNQRLDINNPVNTFYQMQKQTDKILPKSLSSLPSSLTIAAYMAALEVIKWLYAGENKKIEGRIVTFDLDSLESIHHILIKRPQCRVCGEPEMKPKAEPVILEKGSQYAVSHLGGFREIPPEDTFEKYCHHISPITGIVQALVPYYSIKDTPVYNYTAGHNIAFRSKTLFWLNQHIRSANGGKGRNWSQAKTGALCEGIERYCLTYHGDEPYITGTFTSLGDAAIHPNECMNYSTKQFQNRKQSNRDCSKFYSLVPAPFNENLDMKWSPVYSLNNHLFKYLPSCYCYAQYPSEDEYNLFSYPDSNGCAAGNTIEEAILQGFLELVERDSVAIWWYNMLRRPAIDLLSFHEPYFDRLMHYYSTLNRSLYVIDLTTDLRIPAFGAVSHRIDVPKEDIIFGFGAHIDVKIAVERALVELNQILPIVNVPDSNREEGKYLTKDKNFIHWLNTATRENQPYLIPIDDKEKKQNDYPLLCKPTIYNSVLFCIETAAQQGLETFVLNLTKKDVGLPVARVFVPGMRHFWKRLAPGRLYDVPVKMGWLYTTRTEDELNPIGLFL